MISVFSVAFPVLTYKSYIPCTVRECPSLHGAFFFNINSALSLQQTETAQQNIRVKVKFTQVCPSSVKIVARHVNPKTVVTDASVTIFSKFPFIGFPRSKTLLRNFLVNDMAMNGMQGRNIVSFFYYIYHETPLSDSRKPIPLNPTPSFESTIDIQILC